MMGKVEKGEGMTEVLKVELVMKWKKKRLGSRIRSIQDQCLGEEEYGDMVKDTCKSLKNMIENKVNIIMMRDFNCKEVCLEEWYTVGGEESWSSILLYLVMNKIMTQ